MTRFTLSGVATGWLLLTLSLLLPVSGLRAAPVVQAWVQRYPGTIGYPSAQGTRIAVDNDGNLIVGGNNFAQGFILKYSNTGVALWTNWWENSLQAMTLDSAGNVYVAGGSLDGMYFPLTYDSAAFSRTGTLLWTNRYVSSTSSVRNQATGVAVDNAGNVYVTGFTCSNPDGPRYYVTISYSNTGAPFWTNFFLAYSTYPVFIAVDNLDRVYVSGTRQVPVTEGYILGDGTVAYSSTGLPLWSNGWPVGGWMGGDVVRAQALDRAGNVYVAGSLATYSTSSGDGLFTSAFSRNGALLWTNRFGAPPMKAYASGIAVGSNGNVYVTGYASGMGKGYDYLTIAYSSLGAPLWTNRYDGPANTNDCAQAIAVGKDGIVYVTGYSSGTNSAYDYLTLAYSSDGVPLWTNRYNGPGNGNDQAFALAVDGSGNVFITGYSQGDCVTIKYVPSPLIWFSAIDLVPGPACRLTISAPPTISFRLEASTNLVDWLLLTNYANPPGSPFQFTDALAVGFPRRFYRAAWAP